MAKNIIGADAGFGNTKIVGWKDGRQVRVFFPSVLGVGSFSDDLMAADVGAEFIVKMSRFPADGVLNVGETAVRLNRGGHCTNDQELFVRHYNPRLTMAGVARLVAKFGLSPEIDKLVVGLPVADYEGSRDALAATLTGEHCITLHRQNGQIVREVKLKIAEVAVIPQGYGAYCSWAINGEGKKIKERLAPTAIWDGGHSTFDVVGAEGAYQKQFSASLPSVYEEVQMYVINAVRSKTKEFLQWSEIESYLRQGKSFKGVDLASLRSDAVAACAPRIVNLAVMATKPIRPEVILVSGGSGIELLPYYPADLPIRKLGDEVDYTFVDPVGSGLEQVDNAIFANALGYFRYGLMRSISEVDSAAKGVKK